MHQRPSKRTTLTLPAECLEAAGRIAQERHQNLSSVVAEALQRGLREEEQMQQAETVWQMYQQAFAGFSEEELMLLDGIVLAPRKGSNAARRPRK